MFKTIGLPFKPCIINFGKLMKCKIPYMQIFIINRFFSSKFSELNEYILCFCVLHLEQLDERRVWLSSSA